MSKNNDLNVTLETPNFSATATSFRTFVPKKNADEKGSIPVRVRRIVVNCKASGNAYRFPLTMRGNVATFGDSRDSANINKRRTVREMRAELIAMLGEEIADRLINVAMYS
jgi:hypothetical protein